MESISFFVPISYHKQDKTISEKALEAVSGYLDLGSKYRVEVFTSESENPGFSVTNHQMNRQGSWMNTTFKIVSYGTLILPCIALFLKGGLFVYLQVSCIKKQNPNPLISNMPDDLLKKNFIIFKL